MKNVLCKMETLNAIADWCPVITDRFSCCRNLDFFSIYPLLSAWYRSLSDTECSINLAMREVWSLYVLKYGHPCMHLFPLNNFQLVLEDRTDSCVRSECLFQFELNPKLPIILLKILYNGHFTVRKSVATSHGAGGCTHEKQPISIYNYYKCY